MQKLNIIVLIKNHLNLKYFYAFKTLILAKCFAILIQYLYQFWVLLSFDAKTFLRLLKTA